MQLVYFDSFLSYLFHFFISLQIDNGMEERRKHLELQWPVFILYGNGEVYYTITSLGRNRYDYE